MASFSSSLPSVDMKKLTFSDQLLSPSRRKVFSPFGLSVLFSFIVLTVVLFNFSSKAPIFNPVFQGLQSLGSYSNNTSLLSWPFSGGLKDSGDNSSLSGFDDTVNVENVKGSNESLGFDSSDGKNETFENAHFVGNESEVKLGERNGSDYVQNTILVDNSGERADLGTARVEDSVNSVKNGSSEELFNSGNSTVEYEDGKGGNSSYDGVIGDLKSNGPNGPSENKKSFKDCDIFNGKWVRDEEKLYYPPGSCPFIDKDFDCHLNGRPDNQYVKWRWQPFDCDIPRLNATDFLERLRGKKLVFVGDSLNRNMWESLVCTLRQGVQDKNRVYEISGKHEFKKKGFYAFRFEDYDCSVDFVSSPFLVKESSSFNGRNGSFETLRLDLMDSTTSMYHDADVIIFNTGHWWTHEKTSRGEDYYQEGDYVHPRLKVLEAYKRALFTWAKWVDNNIDTNKTEVIYRGYSVTHFRGGPWNSGGQCNNETEPIFNDNHLAKYPSKMKVLEYVLKDMKTPVSYLNISRLTDYRKDGHPSIYRPDYLAKQEVHAQDCSHWCLPGVPDTWNELLYVSLLKSGRGSWKE